MVTRHVALDPTLNLQAVGDDEKKDSATYAWRIDGYQRMARFVQRAVEMGVMLLAGTDGEVGLVDELLLYEKAGIPPQIILQSATRNGAEWLGRSAEFGTLQPGRFADLLIVPRDPLASIEALRAPDVVIQSGVIVYQR